MEYQKLQIKINKVNASMEILYRHNVLRIFSFIVSQIVKCFATLNHLVEQESILTTVIHIIIIFLVIFRNSIYRCYGE